MKREDEIASALDDAAGKVALYHGVWGTVSRSVDVGPGLLDFNASSSISLVYDAEQEKYRSALRYDPESDVLVTDDAVFVRVRYATANPLGFEYSVEQIDGAPEWIKKPPLEIAGYTAAVGFARNQRRLKDTIAKSYENAVAALLTRLSTRVVAGDVDDSSGGFSQATIQISEGALECFMVLEIWIEKESRSVWTLAVANPQ
jgi:ABC-type Fe3+ transport system substrate-binding protein